MTPEQFVSALRARGVTLSVRNNRLRLDPGATWRQLTVDEAQCVAEHRAAIKHLVDEPVPPPVPLTRPDTEPTPEAVSTPEPPPRVYSADCRRFVTEQDLRDACVVGTDRAAYERAEMWLREQVRERRANTATNVMLVSLLRHQRGTHGGYRK